MLVLALALMAREAVEGAERLEEEVVFDLVLAVAVAVAPNILFELPVCGEEVPESLRSGRGGRGEMRGMG